ncbi:uncharacterized protein RJT20DRAFT_7875 [Scheffersomyces xylosifermentans]|uniref:uncharacterized protein n=1 Tax=Scheffersomyces xylosifermentans TaxID=1304137 RepID=UPI00315DDC78
MNSERPSSFHNKDFRSLVHRPKSSKVSGGPKPLNTLTDGSHKRTQSGGIAIIDDSNTSLHVEQSMQRASDLRAKLGTITNNSAKIRSPSASQPTTPTTPRNKKPTAYRFTHSDSQNGRILGSSSAEKNNTKNRDNDGPLFTPKKLDVFSNIIDLTPNGLDKPPLISIPIKSLQESSKRQALGPHELAFNISSNGRFIFISNYGVIQEKLIVRPDQLRALLLPQKYIILCLQDGKGYIVASHNGDDEEIRDFFKESSLWKFDNSLRTKSQDVEEILKKLPTINDTFEVSEHEPLLSRISPSKFYSPNSRLTRSRTKDDDDFSFQKLDTTTHPIVISEDKPEIIPNQREVPHSFSPDLKYSFSQNKVYTITYNDFKTLYNNDWINDTIIDFFIQYEINKAVHKNHVLREDQIHAFNSFFFTKLMSRSSTQDTPNYYNNIKRWLTKLDLMKLPYIIIPINENAHWYCCIIRGLPELLRLKLIEKKYKSQLQVPNSQENDQNPESSTSGISTDDVEVVNALSKLRNYHAEIFVFDSLGQPHENIKTPLKEFIKEYCIEKYGFTIARAQIHVLTARVPKQNNFNDCGIHVIYNVRKYLSNIPLCEKMWRGAYSPHLARSMFIAEERNIMRKSLIKLLLELHNDKVKDGSAASTEENEHNVSDDDLEVIEFDSQKEARDERSARNGDIVSSKNDETQYSTLDPKAQFQKENSNHAHNPLRILTNESLSQRFNVDEFEDFVVEILNQKFDKKNKELSEDQKDIVDAFITNVKGLKEQDPKAPICIRVFLDQLQENDEHGSDLNRPRNQEFRIEHSFTSNMGSPIPHKFQSSENITANDSMKAYDSDEINESVSQLNIRSAGPSTPQNLPINESNSSSSDTSQDGGRIQAATSSPLHKVSEKANRNETNKPGNWASPKPINLKLKLTHREPDEIQRILEKDGGEIKNSSNAVHNEKVYLRFNQSKVRQPRKEEGQPRREEGQPRKEEVNNSVDKTITNPKSDMETEMVLLKDSSSAETINTTPDKIWELPKDKGVSSKGGNIGEPVEVSQNSSDTPEIINDNIEDDNKVVKIDLTHPESETVIADSALKRRKLN